MACCDAKSGSGDAHTHRKATIGIGPYKIPSSMYIGNRQRLLDRFSRIANTPGNSAIMLQGGIVPARTLVVAPNGVP